MKEYFPQGFEDVRHWVAKGAGFRRARVGKKVT
jgi:hypothetical protein